MYWRERAGTRCQWVHSDCFAQPGRVPLLAAGCFLLWSGSSHNSWNIRDHGSITAGLRFLWTVSSWKNRGWSLSYCLGCSNKIPGGLSATSPESSWLWELEPRVKVLAHPMSGEAASWFSDTSPHCVLTWGRGGILGSPLWGHWSNYMGCPHMAWSPPIAPPTDTITGGRFQHMNFGEIDIHSSHSNLDPEKFQKLNQNENMWKNCSIYLF